MNETIQEARQQALAKLKPTREQLEHGLELHAHSVVCESYGFAPRAAVDGDAIKKAVEEGASEAEITDLIEEGMMTRFVSVPEEREEFRQAFDAAGVTCILQNAGEECQSALRILKRLARFTYSTDHMPEFLRKALTADDILEAKKNKRHCLMMSANGVPLPEKWISVHEELGFIRIFHQLGVRMMHLTYNRRNMIGDGCAEPSNAGLSDFGRAVVKEMNRVGVIVDVAHAGWQTCIDAAKTSSKPVVVSHSGCHALNAHCRCKPDDVIEAVVDSGGYIGIVCVPAFLGRSEDIRAMLDHIDHVVQKFGAGHVTIGTDVDYRSRNWEREWKKLPQRPKTRPRWEGFWPPNDALLDPKYENWSDRSMAWTNWPLFTVGMVQRGYSDEDIQKIIGGNVLRVVREVCGS